MQRRSRSAPWRLWSRIRPKVMHFHAVGPERFEMVAGVNASPKRVAAAFDVAEKQVLPEYLRRLQQKQEVAEISSAEAPVHQVILTGDQIDLTRLPFYLQHEFDGAPYISAALDFAIDPATNKPNVGCRRLMLKSRTTLRSNLTQPSDLRRIYLGCVERKEKLPVSFVIGVHPCDFLAATSKAPIDEFELIARIRGETLPMVRGVTNNVPVPADAELVIEGYFDEAGYSEIEGPYGELYGLYGPMHPDPIFHATAITMRHDVLHQTLLHGGLHLTRNDAAQLSAVNFAVMVWRAVKEAGIDVADVYLPPAATGLHHARIAIRQKAAGEARAAIAAVMKLPLVKHVFVTDDDVDLRSEEAMEWAFATRFRADRDIDHRRRPLRHVDGPDRRERQNGESRLRSDAAGRRARHHREPALADAASEAQSALSECAAGAGERTQIFHRADGGHRHG